MKRLPICAAAVFALLCMPAYAASPTASHSGAHGASPTPYAGEQNRQIKALSADEVSGYVSGGGMGFARAAELNSYPGPMHVLELKAELDLSADVAARLAELMREHKAQARGLGEKVVQLEQQLDVLYRERRATVAAVEALTLEIGAAQARYRAAHLTTHIATAAMLSKAQIARYNTLRGYGAAAQGHRYSH